MMGNNGSCKLCAGALGISFGVVTGLCMMLFAWSSFVWGYGTIIVDQWASIYPGYTATIGGGIIGFFWGLLEGFIIGFLLGWIYNFVCKRCCCKVCSASCDTTTKKM